MRFIICRHLVQEPEVKKTGKQSILHFKRLRVSGFVHTDFASQLLRCRMKVDWDHYDIWLCLHTFAAKKTQSLYTSTILSVVSQNHINAIISTLTHNSLDLCDTVPNVVSHFIHPVESLQVSTDSLPRYWYYWN